MPPYSESIPATNEGPGSEFQLDADRESYAPGEEIKVVFSPVWLPTVDDPQNQALRVPPGGERPLHPISRGEGSIIWGSRQGPSGKPIELDRDYGTGSQMLGSVFVRFEWQGLLPITSESIDGSQFIEQHALGYDGDGRYSGSIVAPGREGYYVLVASNEGVDLAECYMAVEARSPTTRVMMFMEERRAVLESISELETPWAQWQSSDDAPNAVEIVRVLATGAQALSREGFMNEAILAARCLIEFVDEGEGTELVSSVLIDAVSTLSAANLAEEALRLTAKVTDTSERIHALTGVIQHAVQADFPVWGSLVQRIVLNSHSMDADLAASTSDLLVQGHLDAAALAARSISDGVLRARAQRKVVENMIGRDRFDGAVTVARSISDPLHRTVALANILRWLARHQNLPTAQTLLNEIVEPSLKAVQVREAIDESLQLGEFAGAISLFSLIETRDDLNSAKHATLGRLVDADQFDLARKLIDTIDDGNLQGAALASLARGLARRGLVNDARVVATSIHDVALRIGALADTIQGSVHAGRYDEGIETIALIPDAKQRDDAAGKMVELLIQAQRWQQAQAFMRMIAEVGQRATAQFKLVHALLHADQVSEAEGLAHEITWSEVRDRAQYVVVRSLIHIDMTDRAVGLADRIQSPELRARAFRLIVHRLASHQQANIARAVASFASRLEMEGRMPQQTITDMLRRRQFNQALNVASALPPEERAHVLREMSKRLAKMRLPHYAKWTAAAAHSIETRAAEADNVPHPAAAQHPIEDPA